jgi:hypothetical protein
VRARRSFAGFYVLSPPIVMWVFGFTSWNGIYADESPVFNVIYAPLISLSNRYDDVYEFYVWYFGFFPLQDYQTGSGPGGLFAA